MNVLYLINYAGSGGTERYLFDLAANYARGKVFFIYNAGGRLREKISEAGIDAARVKMRGPLDIIAARRVAKYCARHNIKIIHTQFMRETYIALLAKLMLKNKIKIVYTCHIDAECNFIWRILNSALGKGIDRYIAVCGAVRRTMIKNKMPADKITIIHHGVGPSPEPGTDIRGEAGIGADEFIFATLTRFTPEKGAAFLLTAIKKLKDMTSAPFRVLIAGEGPQFAELRELAAEYGIEREAVFLGYRTDSGNVLASAAVYLNTSESECLSYAILEAIGRGLPVIATDAGGNPDIVNDEYGCGFTVRYGDADALAERMLAFMNDAALVKETGERAKKTAAEKFDAARLRGETYKLYNVLDD